MISSIIIRESRLLIKFLRLNLTVRSAGDGDQVLSNLRRRYDNGFGTLGMEDFYRFLNIGQAVYFSVGQ